MKYRLDIEYKGTNFSGWQIQRGARTVQGELENALKILYKKRVPVTGAGRTDAGVHALEQVAHFTVNEKHSPDALKRSLNGLIDKDITVKAVKKANNEFHARYSAKERHYRYMLSTENISLYREYIPACTFPLKINTLRKLLPEFTGAHDFVNFCILPEKGTTLCTVTEFSLKKRGNLLEFNIKANRFLHKMVRMIIGALLEAGRGKVPADTVIRALNNKKGPRIGACAAACGLTLIKVIY